MPYPGRTRVTEQHGYRAGLSVTLALALTALWRGLAADSVDIPDEPPGERELIPLSQGLGAQRTIYARRVPAPLAHPPHPDADALLVRRAFAPGELDNADFEALLKHLRAAFANAENPRVEDLPLREQALFAVLIDQDPQAALERAKENWAHEKGWGDATLLIDAAREAARRQAAARAPAWRQTLHKGEL